MLAIFKFEEFENYGNRFYQKNNCSSRVIENYHYANDLKHIASFTNFKNDNHY